MENYCTLRGEFDVRNGDSFDSIIDNEELRRAITRTEDCGGGKWAIELQWSCEGQENLAEGDLEDDISPHFRELLSLVNIYGARFEFRIVVGEPHPDPFRIKPQTVAMIAVLGASISARTGSKEIV
jgi:hypothetical protein